MLQFYSHLYTSGNIGSVPAVKWRLRHNAGSLALWLIILCDGRRKSVAGANQLEVVHSSVLQQRYWRRYCRRHGLMIIGLAEGRWQALELVGTIVGDCVTATGNTDVLKFLFPEENPGIPVPPAELPVSGC